MTRELKRSDHHSYAQGCADLQWNHVLVNGLGLRVREKGSRFGEHAIDCLPSSFLESLFKLVSSGWAVSGLILLLPRMVHVHSAGGCIKCSPPLSRGACPHAGSQEIT